MEDKADPNVKPVSRIVPFYVIPEPIHQTLLQLASAYRCHLGVLHSSDYPWKPAPAASCLGTVSIFDSVFQFSLSIF